MQIRLQKQFLKQFKKLSPKIQSQFYSRVELFLEDQTHYLLHAHELKGPYVPMRSMNVTGYYRALFIIEGEKIVFYKIATHSELYS